MSKVLASVFLLILLAMVVLGNFWFVYGLWPKSWWLFCLFGVLQLVVSALFQIVTSEKS